VRSETHVETTQLAIGRISGAEVITVQLVEQADSPAVIMIRWPGQPTVTSPDRLSAVADVMAVLAAAFAQLAIIRAGQQP
jgi:hypothetical protein